MTVGGYGIPLMCPKCPEETAHRILKTPRIKVPKCGTCGAEMVPCDKSRRAAWAAHGQRKQGVQ